MDGYDHIETNEYIKKTAWVTKHALTSGIQKHTGRYSKNQDRLMVNNYCESFNKLGKDFHFTKKEAIARAEEMRKKKIASLKKQIAKLEKLKF